MSKRIAYCADGTWDTATSHTNVYKLFKALTVSATQMPFYDDGVGANGNPIIKLVGGAFGTGLWQKIKEGYSKIAHVYEAGDSVFIFGFSRGAYTARSLAGMIGAAGLPTANFSDDVVNTAFDAYRAGNTDLRQNRRRASHRNAESADALRIHVISPGRIFNQRTQVALLPDTERHEFTAAGSARSRVIGDHTESRAVQKLGNREHLVLRVAVPACQNHQGRAFTPKEAPVEHDAVVAPDLYLLRVQIRKCRETPVVAVISRVKRPLRSNPPDRADNRQR